MEEIEIVDGKAEVTRTITEVTIYELEQLDSEIQAIQNDIDRLEAKKLEKQNIRKVFEK